MRWNHSEDHRIHVVDADTSSAIRRLEYPIETQGLGPMPIICEELASTRPIALNSASGSVL
jgi:hypothetical protein